MGIYNGKEFTEQQIRLIQLGIDNGLNVEAYAKPYYTPEKMSNIVSVLTGKTHRYNGKEYTDEQIEIIRIGLDANLDVDMYANPKFSVDKMELIMYIMLSQTNLDYQVLGRLDERVLKLITSGIDKNLKVYHLVNTDYSYEQALEIYFGLEDNIDISEYSDPKFSSRRMELIRVGLTHNVDVSEYLELNRNDIFQRVSDCILHGWDAELFKDTRLTAKQIVVILEGMSEGYDVSVYAKPGLPMDEMYARLDYIKENGSLSGYKSKAREVYESGLHTPLQVSDNIKNLYMLGELPKDSWFYVTEFFSLYCLKHGENIKDTYVAEVKHLKRILNLEKLTPTIECGTYSDEQVDFMFDIFDAGDDYASLAKSGYTLEEMKFIHNNPKLAHLICKPYTSEEVYMLEEFKDSDYFEYLANPEITSEHMSILYHDLVDGYDISLYCSPQTSIDKVKFLSLLQRYDYDIEYFCENDFSDAQIKMLTRGVIKRIPILDYAKPEFSVSFMAFIEMALENNINIKDIITKKYSDELEYELFSVVKDSAKPDAHRRKIYAKPMEV